MAVEKKETLSETVARVPPSGTSAKDKKRQILKEMAQKKNLEREEKKDEQQHSKQKEAFKDPSTDEKARKAHIKALRMKAVEEAMKEKSKNAAKSEPVKEENFEEEDNDDLDPSSLVEAEMDENYEDTLVEVNIPGKHSQMNIHSWTFQVNISVGHFRKFLATFQLNILGESPKL